MCDDVQALIAEMTTKKVECSPVDEQRWGSITRLTLPGGGKLGVYQPKHASPLKATVDVGPARARSALPRLALARRPGGTLRVSVLALSLCRRGEPPSMPFRIARAVLALSVRLIDWLRVDASACQSGPLVMRIDVVHEHQET